MTDVQPVMAGDQVPVTRRSTPPRTAYVLALVSAAAFGTSGPFGKALFQGGWSPAAAVTARIGIAALVLAIPTVLELRGRWHLLRRNLGTILLYGMTGVAGCQLFYFVAVEHLSVGVALLLEYLSPVLLVGYAWLTTRRRPSRLTVAGSLAALAGLALVLNVLGDVRLDLVGVAFGLAAAFCSAAYFVVASRSHEEGLSPLALAGAGMAAGVLPLVAVGALGLLPMRASTDPVPFAGHRVSFLVPLLGIAVLAAAFAYVTGVVSARMLGSRLASFVALSEVIFAVLFAWWFLGELPLPVQLAGGALIVVGVLLVRAASAEEDEPLDG
ncbi:EamA family transporter [Luteipulveratus flavus]|uniref:EamA family transporter n=1 Tax=Luteipulveratus flavus TaxID=3031728 RepID=A0ABT6CBR9_9MICO|nr:EamA family transporter [Luteipulveratus sp. YIM 133296]MDF8264716.1 EamA family transporter [Luteipulveratus sp. YIM 133296]